MSRQARVLLDWMDFYRRNQNVARTCRHFGISRQTFYRWRRRYDPQNLATLEERSHRPHRRRRPTWSPRLADRVLALRQRYPRWGKAKLAVLLCQQQFPSFSFHGGPYPRPTETARPADRSTPQPGRRQSPPLRSRPYAIRKPKQYTVSQLGDLGRITWQEAKGCACLRRDSRSWFMPV